MGIRMKNYQIAVDGPAGSGKSTVAKRIAKALGIVYLDTGAMYRAFTYKVLEKEIDFSDLETIKKMLQDTDIKFEGDRIYLDSDDVSEEIRSKIVSNNVSAIAAIDCVRTFLVDEQKKIANECSVIMDGRDIGTKVMPNAEFKYFLIASIEERARRRHTELQEKGLNVKFEDIKREIEERDEKDSSRANSPMKQAEDAKLLDTTLLTIDEVVSRIVNDVKGDYYDN